MSIDKTYISKKKIAAGAALVALSGFVPTPVMQQAHAASAPLNVTGSFVTGVQLAAGNSVKFGTLAATAGNGKVTLSTAGANTVSNAVKVGAASSQGTFSLKVVSTTIGMDITVAGMGAVVLAASAGGGGPTGAVSLDKIILGGAAIGTPTKTTITDGGGGTGKATGVKAGAATGVINVGGQLTWGATQPIGQFTQAITLTMAF